MCGCAFVCCAFVGVRVCGQFARKGWRGVVTAGSNNGGGGALRLGAIVAGSSSALGE